MSELLILAIVSVFSVVIVAIVQSFRTTGNTREALKAGIRSSVSETISNPAISETLERRLQYLPAPLLSAINTAADVFDPITSATEDDLDNDTKQWIKNLTDGDLSTGAVEVKDVSLEI